MIHLWYHCVKSLTWLELATIKPDPEVSMLTLSPIIGSYSPLTFIMLIYLINIYYHKIYNYAIKNFKNNEN